MTEATRDFFETLAQVLFRSWMLGLLILLVWFGLLLLAGGLVHEIHGRMFGLSRHELDLIMYCGMGLFKLLILIVFFIPWAAIQFVLRSKA